MIFKELNKDKCKTYLIACESQKKAFLVDPIQENITRYIAILAYYGLQLELVADTHTHADHRSAVSDIAEITACKIARHTSAPQPNVDVHLDHQDQFAIGSITVTALHTPGHTPDSVSFYFANKVLTGDCLLIGGTGRADFAGGNARIQYDSITKVLFSLPDKTVVLPAHDYRGNTESTILHEKTHNPRIANRTEQDYVEIMENLGLPLPEKVQEVLQVNALESDDTAIEYPSIASLNQVMQLSSGELLKQLNSDHPPLIVDVRETHEYCGTRGHIKGSLSIPLNELASHLEILEQDKHNKIITICKAGVRSTTAAAIITALGFSRVSNLQGGIVEWNKNNLPVVYSSKQKSLENA